MPLLRQAGHEVMAVDLPGEDTTAGLPRYTEVVLEAIGSRRGIVLVAGSLGGFTAPLVCERVPVRELVLVNAMIPNPGETPGDWWTNTGAVEARDAAAEAGGYGPFDVETYFLHDLEPAVVAEGERHQRTEADVVFSSPCTFSSWPDSRCRVLAGKDDRFFPVDFQRRVALERLGVEIDVIPGGHLLPLAQPSLVADYLLDVETGG